MKSLFEMALEAFAVGDAMGMPTEFMTRKEITERFGSVRILLDPSVSLIHANLLKGQVTDDTEQNLYLINEYFLEKNVSVKGTVRGLLKWIEETRAEEKGYIGPSSLRALRKIENGTDPMKAGNGGTTCGAPMRALAAALSVPLGDYSILKSAIFNCSVPTHNTDLAVESAMSMGFAFHSAAAGYAFEDIVASSITGADSGKILSPNHYVGPSAGSKIAHVVRQLPSFSDEGQVLDFIYYVMGTGMEASDVTPAVMGIFAWAREDPWLAIKMGASIGGDTDTIAAMAGALCTLYARRHNIPGEILHEVLETNALKLSDYAEKLSKMFYGNQSPWSEGRI